MAIGIIAGILAGVGGFLAGKSGGGGIDIMRGLEIGTTKKEIMTTTTTAQTYAPTITRTYDISTTYITESPYAQVTTKKEQQISQTPTISPSIITIPTQLQGAGEVGGAGQPAGAGFNIWDAVLIAGVVGGGYFLLKKK